MTMRLEQKKAIMRKCRKCKELFERYTQGNGYARICAKCRIKRNRLIGFKVRKFYRDKKIKTGLYAFDENDRLVRVNESNG